MAKSRRNTGIKVWVPPALKRDLQRLAARAERKMPLSRLCAGLIRLGVGRYFELADAKAAAPLAEAMRDLFDEDDPFPVHVNKPTKPPPPHPRRTPRMQARFDLLHEFNAAIEEGNRYFETVGR